MADLAWFQHPHSPNQQLDIVYLNQHTRYSYYLIVHELRTNHPSKNNPF